MQKNFGVNFIFLRKKGDFLDVFSAVYGQRSVTAAWANRSPWSIRLRLTITYNPHNYISNPAFLCGVDWVLANGGNNVQTR